MAQSTLAEGLSGIYCIKNLVNGRRYVGSSSDMPARWRYHRRHLRLGDHHSRKLQASWDKYGEENFRFDILEYVPDPKLLVEREQFWIDALAAASKHRGLNIAPSASSPIGIIRSAETRAKIAAAKRGLPRPAEVLAKMLRTGTRHTPETIEKMRQSHLGKTNPAVRRLTYEDAQEIRRLRREEKIPQYVLAARFGCSRNSVRQILSWNTYTAPLDAYQEQSDVKEGPAARFARD